MITWLKIYPYKKATIYLQQVGGNIFQYFVVYKNKMWSHFFEITERQSLKHKERGGAAFLVANAAEGLVDALRKRDSIWYNMVSKHWDVSVQKAEEAISAIHDEHDREKINELKRSSGENPTDGN